MNKVACTISAGRKVGQHVAPQHPVPRRANGTGRLDKLMLANP
ncbi:MAG TPA: hypothetical protein VJT32_02315 [bacterium]|nr:hypothetical protein [bacterium]